MTKASGTFAVKLSPQDQDADMPVGRMQIDKQFETKDRRHRGNRRLDRVLIDWTSAVHSAGLLFNRVVAQSGCYSLYRFDNRNYCRRRAV